MDLFSDGLTDNQKINELKEKYKKLLEVEQNGKGKFNLIKGSKSNYNNCILIIIPNISTFGFMNAEYEKQDLIGTIDKFDLDNHIIAYASPAKSQGASRKLIKDSRQLMFDLIDIVQPKLIIVLNDNTSELFLSQKSNIMEQHGTIIAYHYDIPVILTFNLDYYSTKTGYEDAKYKKLLYNEDWTYIQSKYKELINANV